MFWFEVVFGLKKINMGKSELVPVGVVPNIVDMVDVLGCKLGYFPMKYLGLPLGGMPEIILFGIQLLRK